MPRRGTLTSNPSLSAAQTGDRNDVISLCLEEVHALKDMSSHLISTCSLIFALSKSYIRNGHR